jgi:hypothetical protein
VGRRRRAADVGSGARERGGNLPAQQLVCRRDCVADVPAKLARARLLGQVVETTDPNDASSVAPAALHAAALTVVRRADYVTVCRPLAKHHTDVARSEPSSAAGCTL